MPRKTKKTKFDEEAENLAALLSSGNDEDAVLAGQADFWKDFRARVAENDAAIGLESLDHLAMAILQGDESDTLSGTVLLLPPPDAMQAGVAPSMYSSTLTQRRRPRLPSVQPHVQRYYRTWMRHRPLFFACALYAPTKNSEKRRKLKLQATTARNCFLSSNTEEFDYYGFLELFENGSHDKLMWMGGKAAKHSPGAKDAARPIPEDLAVLFAKDHPRYDQVIARALDPKEIDADGYASIPELLEQTQLIDPTRNLHLRLSNRALARIKRGSPADRQEKGGHVQREEVLEQGEDDSDFEDDGEYTALAPTPSLQMPKTSDEDSDEGELSHTGLTEDSEASDDEGGGATPVTGTKAGNKKAAASNSTKAVASPVAGSRAGTRPAPANPATETREVAASPRAGMTEEARRQLLC
ncbi:hypothetical protein PR001_g7409 [Phytophthora rubi]|uniref:Uncharacterized protein n=1 Tax=Phytophthora rubi TaxID=129364 RepID=A0A6A3NEC8_9STRA|nr:hypothetical protein PR001_g7409 [Phytophthora rubi]